MNTITPCLLSLILSVTCAMTNAQEFSESNPDTQLEDALKTLSDRIEDKPSRYHHDRAEVLFRLGRFEESIRDYDSAVHFGWPHNANSCWERGLAQYYTGDYKSAAEQFERYHRVGALDIENGLWRLMCTAEDQDIETARAEMLDYSRKVRPPFPELLKLYLGNGSVEAVLAQAREEASTESDLTVNLFNAQYYVGKYFQLIDEDTRALEHFEEALIHRIPHFMYACAEIDAARLRK